MSALNWVLALMSVVLWGGAFVWYFRDMIREAWRSRNDKWFRD